MPFTTSMLFLHTILFLGLLLQPIHPASSFGLQSHTSRKAFFQQVQVLASTIASSTSSVATVTAITLSQFPASASAAGNLPALGAKAPDFKLPNSRGGETSLNDLLKTGKTTVLYFYPGAFTNGCSLEARNFQLDKEKYQKLNAQIVGVSVDSVEKNAQFCKEEQLDFFMLSDFEGKVSKLYGSALSIPGFGSFSNRQTYIIDMDGNLRWIFTDVESHVSRHSAEVLNKLEELTRMESA